MVNKVILVGRLGRDPELRYTQGGQAVANFTLATNEYFNNRDGERQERTEWHRVVTWGKQAEFCSNYLAKGRQIYVEGRLQTREWEDKEGEKRRTTEVVAMTVQALGSRGDGAGGGFGADGESDSSDSGDSRSSTPPTGPEDSDIPF